MGDGRARNVFNRVHEILGVDGESQSFHLVEPHLEEMNWRL